MSKTEPIDKSSSLLHSLHIQLRVIGALLLREAITRYGRDGLGTIWIFLEPMLFTLGVTLLWYTVKADSFTSMPVIPFVVTGYSTVLLWRNATNRCCKAIEPNLSLMYHRNVKVIDVFLARVILEWVGGTSSFTLLSLFFMLAGVMSMPKDLALVVGGWVLLAWFSLALGFIVGVISEHSDTFDRIWHVCTYLLFPLSGAMFMVHWLPAGFQKVIVWFPMVHGVEMIRHGFFGNMVPTYERPLYFAFVNLVLTLIGFALVRDVGRKVQPE